MVIQEIMHTHPDQFRWIDPPYEYEYNRRPIDLLVGDAELIEGLEGGVDPRILEQSWMQELDTFLDLRSSFLLYE